MYRRSCVCEMAAGHSPQHCGAGSWLPLASRQLPTSMGKVMLRRVTKAGISRNHACADAAPIEFSHVQFPSSTPVADVTLCWATNPNVSATRSTICDLRPMLADKYFCGQVGVQNCESRAKVRTDGRWSACILDDSGSRCTTDPARFDCSPATWRQDCSGAFVEILGFDLSSTIDLVAGEIFLLQ